MATAIAVVPTELVRTTTAEEKTCIVVSSDSQSGQNAAEDVSGGSRDHKLAAVLRPLRFGGKLLANVLLAGCLLALAIRLSVRDGWRFTATFYYMTPWILLAPGFGVCCLLFALRNRRRIVMLTLVCMLVCSVGWSQTVHWSSVATGEPAAALAVPANTSPTQIVFWNTARGKAGWTEIAGHLSGQSAAVIGLVEAGNHSADKRIIWRQQLPRHTFAYFPEDMLIAVQGDILGTRNGRLGSGGHYSRADVLVNGEELIVFVIDIHSHPLRDRREPLIELARLLKPLADRKVIVMGDFNTPADSVHFSPLKQQFRNGFDTVGTGNAATWPVPFPVLAIDHVWVSGCVNLRHLAHQATPLSDHSLVQLQMD